MAKVTNLTDRTVHLHHWKVLPKATDSKLLDPQGNYRSEMPDALAYSDAAKILADNEHLELEGYTPASKVVAVAPEPTPAPPAVEPFARSKRKREE